MLVCINFCFQLRKFVNCFRNLLQKATSNDTTSCVLLNLTLEHTPPSMTCEDADTNMLHSPAKSIQRPYTMYCWDGEFVATWCTRVKQGFSTLTGCSHILLGEFLQLFVRILLEFFHFMKNSHFTQIYIVSVAY